jgi:DNA repair exonuclease SbcCD nuclease subunit
MRIVVVNDTHLGVRGDSLLFNEYFFKFWENQFFPYVEDPKNKIEQILHLGDLVDRRKFTNHVILNSWNERWFKRNKLPMTILVGNHDIPYRNTNDPNAITELFAQHKNVHVVTDPTYWTFGVFEKSFPCLLLPWINDTNRQDSLDLIAQKKVSTVFGHLELTGFEMDKGSGAIIDGMDRKIFDGYEAVYSGHYHHRSTDGTIFYLGTQYEITWADHDDPKGFHIFDTDTRQCEFIVNKERMFYQHVYDNGITEPISHEKVTDKHIKVIVKNRDDVKMFDDYLDQLHKLNYADIQVVESTFAVDNSVEFKADEATDIMTDMSKFVDTQITGHDPKEIMEELRDIHREALNMETRV